MNNSPQAKAEQYASSQYDVNQYTEPDSVKGTGWTDCRDAYLAGYEADRWIPVSDPPQVYTTCLVYCNDEIQLGIYLNQNTWEDEDTALIYPTHWQALPKTPTL